MNTLAIQTCELREISATIKPFNGSQINRSYLHYLNINEIANYMLVKSYILSVKLCRHVHLTNFVSLQLSACLLLESKFPETEKKKDHKKRAIVKTHLSQGLR